MPPRKKKIDVTKLTYSEIDEIIKEKERLEQRIKSEKASFERIYAKQEDQRHKVVDELNECHQTIRRLRRELTLKKRWTIAKLFKPLIFDSKGVAEGLEHTFAISIGMTANQKATFHVDLSSRLGFRIDPGVYSDYFHNAYPTLEKAIDACNTFNGMCIAKYVDTVELVSPEQDGESSTTPQS